jgi:NAD(P)-dependent dehydrogenase (short-subunit alcohol dehydrogenase family)
MSNSKKVVVITGASQGLGAAAVKAYRELDYRVVATSRSIKPSTDPDILTVAGDIADPATAERVIREGVARFGRIDSLINNAGIFVAKPFTSYTHEDYVNVLAVNLNGFFYITQLAITEMLKQGAGHIVNITTSLVDHAIDGVPSVLASLTKGGLNSATKSLAIEYAKRGIRVNAVSPGIIKTPMHGEETHAALGSLHPVGHMGEARDIAQAIVYLESAGFGFPGGDRDFIVERLAQNRPLGHGNQVGLVGRQVLGEVFRHGRGGQIQVAGSVGTDGLDTRRGWVAFLGLGRALALGRRERGHINQCLDLVAGAALSDYTAGPRMAHQNHSPTLGINHPLGGAHIICQGRQRVLHRHHLQAFGLQQRNHLVPAGAIGKGAVHQHHGGVRQRRGGGIGLAGEHRGGHERRQQQGFECGFKHVGHVRK